MSFAERQPEVSTWVADVIVTLVITGLFYFIFVETSRLAVFAGWLWMLGIAPSLFVVYLF